MLEGGGSRSGRIAQARISFVLQSQLISTHYLIASPRGTLPRWDHSSMAVRRKGTQLQR